MGLWRKDKISDSCVYVGQVRNGSLYVAKGKTAEQEGKCHIEGEAVIPMSDPGEISANLNSRLGWESGQPLLVSHSFPLMLGSAVSISVPRHEEGHALVRDSREAAHLAQWRAADRVREETANFFSCSLEDIKSLGASMERWKETSENISGTIFQACVPSWSYEKMNQNTELIPQSESFMLPMLLSKRVGRGDTPEAILHVDDFVSALIVRKNNSLTYVRSIENGIASIKDHMVQALSCSEKEAEILLKLLTKNKLNETNKKSISRIIRDLFPLWTGMFNSLVADIPLSERPLLLEVRGLFPDLIAKYFCKPQILMSWSHTPVKIRIPRNENPEDFGIRIDVKAGLNQIFSKGPSLTSVVNQLGFHVSA